MHPISNSTVARALLVDEGDMEYDVSQKSSVSIGAEVRNTARDAILSKLSASLLGYYRDDYAPIFAAMCPNTPVNLRRAVRTALPHLFLPPQAPSSTTPSPLGPTTATDSNTVACGSQTSLPSSTSTPGCTATRSAPSSSSSSSLSSSLGSTSNVLDGIGQSTQVPVRTKGKLAPRPRPSGLPSGSSPYPSTQSALGGTSPVPTTVPSRSLPASLSGPSPFSHPFAHIPLDPSLSHPSPDRVSPSLSALPTPSPTSSSLPPAATLDAIDGNVISSMSSSPSPPFSLPVATYPSTSTSSLTSPLGLSPSSMLLSSLRRPPIINRGYYSRVAAFDLLIEQFANIARLKAESQTSTLPSLPDDWQVLSLGSGLDSTYWRLKLHRNIKCKRFVEVDFPSSISQKLVTISSIQALRSPLGPCTHASSKVAPLFGLSPSESPSPSLPTSSTTAASAPSPSSTNTALPSASTTTTNTANTNTNTADTLPSPAYAVFDDYAIYSADLRNPDALRPLFTPLPIRPSSSTSTVAPPSSSLPSSPPSSSSILSPSLPTIIMIECVLVYMQPEHAQALLQQLNNPFTGPLVVLIYEQINPHDPFGKRMVESLRERGCALLGLEAVPDLPSQRRRLHSCGFTHTGAWTMLGVFEHFLPRTELSRIEKLELFDELEEWDIMQSHYTIAIGARQGREGLEDKRGGETDKAEGDGKNGDEIKTEEEVDRDCWKGQSGQSSNSETEPRDPLEWLKPSDWTEIGFVRRKQPPLNRRSILDK